MHVELKKYDVERNWIELLLECIEAGITPEEVRTFLYNCIKDSCQN